jgi:hypothetical protein
MAPTPWCLRHSASTLRSVCELTGTDRSAALTVGERSATVELIETATGLAEFGRAQVWPTSSEQHEAQRARQNNAHNRCGQTRTLSAKTRHQSAKTFTRFARANGGTHGMVLVNVKAVVVY